MLPSKSVNQVEGVNTPSLKFNMKEFCDVYDKSTFAKAVNIDTSGGKCKQLYYKDDFKSTVCNGSAAFCVAMAKAGELIMI